MDDEANTNDLKPTISNNIEQTAIPIAIKLELSPNKSNVFEPIEGRAKCNDFDSNRKCSGKLLTDSIKKDSNELLGSVTTFTPVPGAENRQTVRTSARVIQKMKLDSIRPASPLTDKKELLRDDRPVPKTPNQSKSNKNIWNKMEELFFFEALNEFGKDFEAIANYVNTKSKRKHISDITFKSREQVRLFYSQSYQKIAKYLKFSEDVKKIAQELYALINYGEMRRKISFLNEKCLMKLRDLVYKGFVTLRMKGKNVKIKTPSCKALRQLNQLEEWNEEIKLPARIEVLLKPVNLHTWGKVQNLAQNPRIKITLPIQRRVSSLIKTLQRKWKPQNCHFISDEIFSNPPSSSQSYAQKIVKKGQMECENLTHNTNSLNNNNDEDLKIRILPPKDIIIHRPMVNITEFLSSNRICLNAYEDRIGVKVKGETLWSERVTYLKELKTNLKRQRQDSASDSNKKSPDIKKQKMEFDIRPLEPCLKLEKILSDTNDLKTKDIDRSMESSFVKLDKLSVANEMKNVDAIKTDNECSTTNDKIVSMQKSGKDIKSEEKNFSSKKREKSNVNKKKDLRKDPGIFRPLISEETMQKIREGWTLSSIGDMTFGDLYIMFGSDLKLNLEYLFIELCKKQKPESVSSSVEISSNITISNTNVIEVKSINLQNVEITNEENLIGNRLKQLLLIANLIEQKKKKQYCGCGHICDRPSVITCRTKRTDDPGSFVSSKTHFTTQNDNNIFRPPAAPMRTNIPVIENFKLNNIRPKLPKWLKVRNRSTYPTKQVVVQRILPLQPGMSSSYDTVNLGNISSITTEKKETTTIQQKNTILPISSNDIITILDDSDKCQTKIDDVKTSVKIKIKSPSTNSENAKISKQIVSNIEDNVSSEFSESLEFNLSQNSFLQNLSENPGFQSLMEISLPSPMRTDYDESRYEVALDSTPPMSPMKLLRELGDCQNDSNAWLTPDFNDFSYSSFLGHLDAFAENSRNGRPKSRNSDDGNVDSTLSVISETSVDYVTKFAQIAEELKEQQRN